MQKDIWYKHALSNRLQSFLLITSMAGFLVLIGWLLWGGDGIFIILAASILLMLLTPRISPRLIMHLYRGRRLSSNQLPGLYNVLIELALRSGLKSVPDIYYLPSSMINAFAVGKSSQASIAITDGLLRSLNSREAIGVLAHEISHIRSNDISVMALADLFSRLTSTLSLFGQLLLLVNLPLILLGMINISWLLILVLILAPLASTLAQLGLSRTREYDADLNAVKLTGDPEGLASALLKIDNIQGGWIERLVLPGRGIPEPSFLRTHPPTEERVRRLLSLTKTSDAQTLLHTPDSILSQHLGSSKVKRQPRWHLGGLWH